jgi:hypothetical protein
MGEGLKVYSNRKRCSERPQWRSRRWECRSFELAWISFRNRTAPFPAQLELFPSFR